MSGTPRADTRPLSPHLQVWRPHATMAASITHRITGVALYFGTFLIAAWLVALATGSDTYGLIETLLFSWFGKVVLYFWAVAVLFHFVNGIRHLLWDGPGVAFGPKAASAFSIFNYTFAFLGAAAIWAAAAWL
ncbi:MAG: succinate dehydrogenase, cytochrome b556 subunit [Hyphomonas sp.]|uniref:succinate dehydrogenase, cytochrome b556 subunit n=1 Tax=Hyphomonas sp. TaxID=87 RepID=UPI00352924E7